MPRAHRTLTAPPRRAIPATITAVLAVLLALAMSLSACSSSKSASSTPTSTTTAQQHQEAIWRQQINDLEQNWYQAFESSFADPTHPADLERYAVDPQLAETQQALATFRAKHQAGRRAPHPKDKTWILDISFQKSDKGLIATYHTCTIDDHWTVDLDTGRPINTQVATYRATVTAIREQDGTWKLETGENTTTPGVSGCAIGR